VRFPSALSRPPDTSVTVPDEEENFDDARADSSGSHASEKA